MRLISHRYVIIYPASQPFMLLFSTHSVPVLLETSHAVRPGGQQGCHITPHIQRRQSCMYVCAIEHVMYVSILQSGQYMYGEVGVFASPLCKYDLRKRDSFVLYWVRVRRVCIMWWYVVFYCFVAMVVYISSSVMGSGFVLMLCMYPVLLNVFCFLSLEVCWSIISMCSGCDDIYI